MSWTDQESQTSKMTVSAAAQRGVWFNRAIGMWITIFSNEATTQEEVRRFNKSSGNSRRKEIVADSMPEINPLFILGHNQTIAETTWKK